MAAGEAGELVAAIADLDEDARHAFTRSAAEMRDRRTAAGDHREARMWNALAALLAGIEDDHRARLRAMQLDLAGGSARLLDE